MEALEKVISDSSGKFRVMSLQGNRYYSVFVCARSGWKLYFAHRKKSHCPMVYLKFLARPDVQFQPANLPARMRTLHSSSADSEDSDPMDFDNEVLEALAHLDHTPTLPTIVKISSIQPSSKSSPSAYHARGGSNDLSDEDMASYDGDSNCHSDEDEDDDRSPVYATRSLAHGVKQPTLDCQ